MVEAGVERRQDLTRGRVSRHRDKPHRGNTMTYPPRHLVAVRAGHQDIQEDDVGTVVRDQAHGFLAVGGGAAVMSPGFQQHLHRLTRVRAVVRDQHAEAIGFKNVHKGHLQGPIVNRTGERCRFPPISPGPLLLLLQLRTGARARSAREAEPLSTEKKKRRWPSWRRQLSWQPAPTPDTKTRNNLPHSPFSCTSNRFTAGTSYRPRPSPCSANSPPVSTSALPSATMT